jgi:hypothetical protein
MTDPGDLTCQDFVELVTDYLEGVLSQSARERFDLHIAVCPPCLFYLNQIRETTASLGTLREEHIMPDARATLLAEFRDWKRGNLSLAD